MYVLTKWTNNLSEICIGFLNIPRALTYRKENSAPGFYKNYENPYIYIRDQISLKYNLWRCDKIMNNYRVIFTIKKYLWYYKRFNLKKI